MLYTETKFPFEYNGPEDVMMDLFDPVCIFNTEKNYNHSSHFKPVFVDDFKEVFKAAEALKQAEERKKNKANISFVQKDTGELDVYVRVIYPKSVRMNGQICSAKGKDHLFHCTNSKNEMQRMLYMYDTVWSKA